MYQCEWEVIIREYTDVEGTGSIAAEMYVFDQATGQKRTVTTMTLDGENDLINATYNPQNQTIVVTRSGVDGGKNYVDTYDYESGQLVSSVLVSTQVNGSGKRAYSDANVFALPPDLSGPVAALSENVSSIEKNVSGLNSRVNNLSHRVDQLDTGLNDLNDKVDQVGALAAALEIERPIAGKTFRLGADVGFFGDETAVGLSFSTIRGRWDGGAGIAFARDESMGKVSAGLNW